MKKKLFIFSSIIFYLILIIILLVSISVSAITGDIIFEDTITGEVTVNNVGLTISITGSPRLTIITPKNSTYIYNGSIPLDFTAGGEQAVWYNLDNGANITLTNPITFNTTTGSHTLYLFANNTAGNTTSKNVTFNINLTLFTILFSEFNGSHKGDSTNFYNFSYTQMQNLSDIILENSLYGKIKFLEAINLTADSNFSDNLLDINSSVNISSNRIEIDTESLPNFNKSATLILYNLTFITPRILIDSVVCPSTICTQNSYSGRNLSFNVTHFSTFSAEETPTGEVIEEEISKGGGRVIKNFSINKDKINLNLRVGQKGREQIIIENEGNTKIKIILENLKLEDFMKIDEPNFDLRIKESKLINLDFMINETVVPNLYLGKLIINGGEIRKEVIIALEIESRETSFDVKAEILEAFLQVAPGEEIKVDIIIYNINETGTVDFNINYIIKDEEGNILISEQEILRVKENSQLKFTKIFKIPLNTKPANYILYTKVTYEGKTESAVSWFSVILYEKEFPFSDINTKRLLRIILIIIILIILALISHKLRKSKRPYKLRKPFLKLESKTI
ncbi:MAG: hypothetical protein IH845_02470 [Nanoarchaeota archaeon]|nr:hypothetical protein [Nanoarchaeota archaeon]